MDTQPSSKYLIPKASFVGRRRERGAVGITLRRTRHRAMVVSGSAEMNRCRDCAGGGLVGGGAVAAMRKEERIEEPNNVT